MQTHVTLEIDGDIAALTFACDTPGKPATIDLIVLDELESRLVPLMPRLASVSSRSSACAPRER